MVKGHEKFLEDLLWLITSGEFPSYDTIIRTLCEILRLCEVSDLRLSKLQLLCSSRPGIHFTSTHEKTLEEVREKDVYVSTPTTFGIIIIYWERGTDYE